MKKCSLCKKTKAYSSFYKDKRTKNGLYARCKECQDKKMMEYRAGKDYKAYRREYFSKYRNRISKNECEKVKIRDKTNSLVKSGVIERFPCVVCKSEKSEIHHWNYKSITDIVWLCKKHHHETHKLLRA